MCPMHAQAIQYIARSNMMMNMSMMNSNGMMMPNNNMMMNNNGMMMNNNGMMMNNKGMMMQPPGAGMPSGGQPKPVMSSDQVIQATPAPSEAMPPAAAMMSEHPPARERSPKLMSSRMKRQSAPPASSMPMSMNMQMMDCVGDSNCPGAMKCCSNDMSTYGDGIHMMKNMNPTMGHCAEPMMTMPGQ